MSRSRRIPRARDDFYSRHPHRVHAAYKRGDLDFHGFGVLSFLINEIDLGRTGEVAFTLVGLAEALGWDQVAGGEQLRRVLHDLRDNDWIKFDDPRRGPKAPWIFRLARAAIDGDATESPPSFHSGDPSPVEIDSTEPEPSTRETPSAEPGSPPSEFPPSRASGAEPSRAETREDHSTKDDQLLGKTTNAPDVGTKRLLDALERVNERGPADDVHDAIEQAQRAQEREPVHFGIEPVEAEAPLIDEAERLVAEGVLVEVEPSLRPPPRSRRPRPPRTRQASR